MGNEIYDSLKLDLDDLAEKAKVHSSEKAAEAAKLADTPKRIKRMKASGDFAEAINCGEVAKTVGAKDIELNELVHEPYKSQVTPTNRYIWLAGTLDQLNGNAGYLKGPKSGEFSSIRLSNKMAWEDKDSIRVKNKVTGVGKYVANTTITLTNNQSLTIPVYDIVCLKPLPAIAEMLFLK